MPTKNSMQNWVVAKAAGVPRGAYHFAYWCRSGEQQAAWFIQHVPNDPQALPPVLDVEWNPVSQDMPAAHPARRGAGDDEDHARRHANTPMARSRSSIRRSIFTAMSSRRRVLGLSDVGAQREMTYPDVKYAGRHWNFWQHTAQGHVPGIRGYVDRNAFYGSSHDWHQWLVAEAVD